MSKQKFISSAEEIIDQARRIGRREKMRLGVASAADRDVLAAVVEAKQEGMVEPILIGDVKKIQVIAGEQNLDLSGMELIDIPAESRAAAKTAELAAKDEIQIVMKGFIQTSTLLKTILKAEYGLRMRDTLSHSALMSIPEYHKLLNITDGGMVLEPTLEQKISIIQNAALVANALGIEKPKIALHSSTDYVLPELKSSLDCAILTQMGHRGQLGNIFIDGPLTLDTILIKATAEATDFHSPVAGDADVLVVSSIDEGNIIAKALVSFAGAVFSGVVVGAKVPISLVSRTDSSLNKKSSIALAVILAQRIRKS